MEFCRAFRITSQGVHLSGKANLQKGSRSESNKPASNEGRALKRAEVTRMQPETNRSNPEQGEVGVKPRGSLKRSYVQVLF